MNDNLAAALVAAAISLIGILVNILLNERKQSASRKQWQESFRAELRRDLFKETSVDVIKTRFDHYAKVWEILKITSGYHIKRSNSLKEDIQNLANELSDFAYSTTGLLMTDRSRRLLNYLRAGCGDFLKENISIEEVRKRAHLLKHSLRSDLGIGECEYENEINIIAQKLGRVDEW